MDVGGIGDCLAMDIVEGQGSFPKTLRGEKYILTIIYCYTRFAVAVPLSDQCSNSVNHEIIGNYITV